MPAARLFLSLTLALVGPALCVAQTRASRTLDIYTIDVEGGNATLLVSPSGESLLIDSGNGGNAAPRDAGRILDAVRDAGLRQIDHLITTHWHGDHFGGMSELASRIPIKNFIDHGPSVENNPGATDFLQKVYPGLYAKGTHTVAKPGDRIAMKGLDIRIASAAGQVLQSALPGAGRNNPLCAAFKQQAADATENAQSVGTHLAFGRFRLVHMGDLTVNKEFDLMCMDKLVGDPEALARYSSLQIVEEAGSQGVELLNWIAMRGALTGDVGKVHGNYHVPISNTASALLVLENRTHALETTYRKAS